ncbi:MAG: hypothetical protein PVI78_08275 [Anaerolineales bacterium]
MKGTNKVLIAIAVGAILLVGIAIALMLFRPEPTYRSEDSPEGVAHNYLLALQKRDYQRAYSYLSESLIGYPPNKTEFITVMHDSWRFRFGSDTSLSVESSEVWSRRAVVTVRKIRFFRYGLFDSGQRISYFDITLQKNHDQWEIIDAEDYFAWCWQRTGGCD